jgi:ribonuclease/clavin/mitogillin
MSTTPEGRRGGASPKPPSRAASVILCRRPDDLEIYWVRRRDELPFLGGFHSFPGGRLSKNDDPAALGLELPHEDAPLRVCALRELHEETGVLLGRAEVPGPDFVTGLRVGAHRPDFDALVPAGRWVTPPFSPARFDTQFYLAWAPEGAAPVPHDGELASGEWIRPEAALDLWSDGKALLAPPTLYAVRGLAAAVLMASGDDVPLDLHAAAEFLHGSDEAAGGAVTRIEMRPGFFLYPMRTRTLPPATHTNAFLVGGGGLVLVDPGSDDPEELDALTEFLQRLGTEGRSVTDIWLTHHHPDHVGGVAVMAARLKVPVRAHPLTAERLGGLGVPVEPTLVDGYVREMPGRPGWRLRVLHTPGHAPGHVALHEEVSGTLIAGDLVAGVGFILIDPPEGDMAAYLESLERLAALNATALFPSHGPPTAGATARLNEYAAHRREREAKIRAALAAGGERTIDEMLPEVYSDYDSAVWPLAARSFLAHLLKLEMEGRAARGPGADKERWRAIARGGSGA